MLRKWIDIVGIRSGSALLNVGVLSLKVPGKGISWCWESLQCCLQSTVLGAKSSSRVPGSPSATSSCAVAALILHIRLWVRIHSCMFVKFDDSIVFCWKSNKKLASIVWLHIGASPSCVSGHGHVCLQGIKLDGGSHYICSRVCVLHIKRNCLSSFYNLKVAAAEPACGSDVQSFLGLTDCPRPSEGQA